MLKFVKDYPALLHTQKQHKTLIIADLHLGWEINLANRGMHIPSQTPKILQNLLHLTKKTKPNTLLILGDVKHTIARAEPGEWKDIPEFFETLKTKIADIQIIRGNHDGNLEPLLPQNIQLHPSTGITLDTIGLFHGHTWPAKKLLTCNTLIMGHAHPTIILRDNLGFQITTPVWIKARCDTKKLAAAYAKRRNTETTNNPDTALKKQFTVKPQVKELLIMPCFNDFLGGRPINKKSKSQRYIGPLLRSKAINTDKAEVYLLDGTFLGTIQQLKTLS